jgi:hypothetical protein
VRRPKRAYVRPPSPPFSKGATQSGRGLVKLTGAASL